MTYDEFHNKLVQIELDNPDNPFQQGYLSAPIIAEFCGVDTDELAKGIEGRGVDTDDNYHRDMGALQWCREQSK